MKKSYLCVVVVALFALGFSFICGAEEPEPNLPDLEGTALLVIDIQAFYFPDGMVPLVKPEAAASRAARVIEVFRASGRPVIHVQHLPKGVNQPNPTGIEEQYRIHPDVLPKEGEIVIGKHHANSFRDTKLLPMLRKMRVNKLVVTGMQTHMCVEAAVRAAADYEFDVTVIHDACATRALEFDGTKVSAAKIHAGALAAMNGNYAKVLSTDEFCGVAK